MGVRWNGATAVATIGLGAVGAGIAGGVEYFRARRVGRPIDRKAVWIRVGVGAAAGALAGLATCIEFGQDKKTLLDRLSITGRSASAASQGVLKPPAGPVGEELSRIVEKLPEAENLDATTGKMRSLFREVSREVHDALSRGDSSVTDWLQQQLDPMHYQFEKTFPAIRGGYQIRLSHYVRT